MNQQIRSRAGSRLKFAFMANRNRKLSPKAAGVSDHADWERQHPRGRFFELFEPFFGSSVALQCLKTSGPVFIKRLFTGIYEAFFSDFQQGDAESHVCTTLLCVGFKCR